MHSRWYLFINLIISFIFLIPSSGTAQWIQTKGPEGGQVGVIYANGKNVVTEQGSSLFVSTNEGLDWQTKRMPEGIENGILFFKGNELFGYVDDTLLRSSNLGDTWTRLPKPEGSFFAMLKTNDIDLFAILDFIDTTKRGIYRSTDNGETWQKWGDLPTERISTLEVTPDHLFAYYNIDGLYKSTIQAPQWRKIGQGLPADSQYCRGIGVKGNIATIELDNAYISTDGGESWSDLTLPNSFFIFDIIIRDDDLLVFDINGIIRSTDLGKTWEIVNESGNVYGPKVGEGNMLYGSMEGFAVSTDNGATWVKRNKGIIATTVYSLYPYAGYVFAGSNSGVTRTTDLGTTWEDVTPEGASPNFRLIKEIQGFLFAAGFGVYYSQDAGDHWSAAPIGTASDVVKSDAAVIAAIGGIGIYRSVNFGIDWNTSSAGLDNPSALQTHHLAIINNTIFLTTDDGVYLSTNEGASWKKSNGEIIGRTDALATLSNTLFVGSSDEAFRGYIYRSTDLGVTWQRVTQGLPEEYTVNSIYTTDGFVFASTSEGLYLSKNNGETWSVISEGLPTKRIYTALLVDGELLVGTDGAGVWKRPFAQLGVKPVVPQQFELLQNYPNPFNPNTTIRFSLPTSGVVKLTVENVMGQVMQTLVQGFKPAGYHTVEVDANNWGSGVYLYKLEASNTTVVRKMTLMK